LQSLDIEQILKTLDNIEHYYGELRVRTATYWDEKANKE